MNSGKRATVGTAGRVARLLMLALGIVSVPDVGLAAVQGPHCTQHETSAQPGAHSGHDRMPDGRTSWAASAGHQCPHCPATECARVVPCTHSSSAALLTVSLPATGAVRPRAVPRGAQRRLHSTTHQPPTPPPQLIS